MGIRTEDGLGRGYEAGVSASNRLMVASESNTRSYYVSRDAKRLFNWVFEDASAVAGNYVAYIKNTSTTRALVIELVRLQAANAATWKVVTATGTATGGTAVTAVNMNRGSGLTEEATALADNVGGFTAGSALIAIARHPAESSIVVPFDDTLILTPGTAIAIEYDAGTTGQAAVTLRAYYEVHSA